MDERLDVSFAACQRAPCRHCLSPIMEILILSNLVWYKTSALTCTRIWSPIHGMVAPAFPGRYAKTPAIGRFIAP